ncbi:MAG: hypothetical protein V2A73_00085 [Pseudomonadota bacterium]
MEEQSQYLLLIGVDDGSKNVEVLHGSTSLKEILRLKQLVESIEEWGYIEEMKEPQRTKDILEQLEELDAVWWTGDEYLPEVKVLGAMEATFIKTDGDQGLEVHARLHDGALLGERK